MNFHNQFKGHVISIHQYDEKQLFHTRTCRTPYFLQVICLKKQQDRSPETKDFKFPFFIALSTTGDTWQSKS